MKSPLFSTDKGVRVLLLAASALVLALSFGRVVWHPNEYFFGNAGDAIRAYYIILYYVKYNVGLRFTGMNYPYGEHINFPDMQPLLAYPLSWLQHHGVPVEGHVIGILNCFTLLLLWLTPLMLFAIARRLGLPRLYAAAVALCIAYMAPQLERLDSHGSMGYTVLVPLLWYLLLRMQAAPRRWLWPVLYGVVSLLGGLLHTYFLLVGALFLLAYALVWALQERQRQPVWPTAIRWAVTALLPLLLFRGWLWLTDALTDRPENPYGFFVYTASPFTVFLPTVSPLREAIRAVLHTPEPTWEGFAYVGLVATVVALLLLIRTGRLLGKGRWRQVLRPIAPVAFRTSLWAAILLLLLSMALPFRLPGGEWLLERLGPLKQFRSLGRFAWVFYYVFSLYTAYFGYQLYRYLAQRGAAGVGRTILGVMLLFWGLEAGIQISTKGQQIQQMRGVSDFVSETGSYRDKLLSVGRRAEEFQAILPLPYFNIGTDKLSFANSANAQYESEKASFNTQLPLLASHMARASVGHTLQLVQLVSTNFVDKPLVRLLPSRKPVLLVTSHDALQYNEQQLVNRARKLYEDTYAVLYELPLDSLAATVHARQLRLFAQRRPTLLPGPAGTLRTTRKPVIRASFAGRAATRAFLSPGAFISPDGFAQLYRGPLTASPADTGRYEVSVWINARTEYGLGNLQVKQYNAKGEQIDHQVTDTSHSTEIVGDWVRATVHLQVRDPQAEVEVLYENRDLVADDLLIRPLDTDVYFYRATAPTRQVVLNNYPLGPEAASGIRP
ncbi:hypothetical protein FY528_11750 [Hymenobacter lutimineralis]|uniref:DUF6311 domain-containing protein n=1 Tax=Hymenobacter lutimineralis TaxID=2606448 RepID=A0A5D6V1P0_9BACT|nr:hypothetical protein [Hymenobacter lutimineralis]TYZ08882.1 hypothetical protein FY528_11750 [Hymenobacter lutimineralis]